MHASRMIGRGAVAVLAATVVSVAAAAAGPDDAREYDLSGQPVEGVRPTAVGLPRVGATQTIGAGDLPLQLITYHDSGQYDRDIAEVAGAAKAFLRRRLDERAHPPRPACRVRYARVKRPAGKPALYRRVRRCPAAPRPDTRKAAIVFDIDETSLSNYSGLLLTGFAFGGGGLAIPAGSGTGRAIGPVLDLYRYARSEGVDAFFITGRGSYLEGPTRQNLTDQGYTAGFSLVFKPSGIGTMAYKAGARKQIEERGYEVVVNIGDQESDLAGGYATRAFKLPNPFYFIPE